MAQCYDSSAPWGDSNRFCNEISRGVDGQIFQILNRQYNLDNGKARGLDLALNYGFDLGSRGDLMLDLDYTHMYEDSDTYEGLDGLVEVDYTGQLDFGNFDDRATASLTWRYSDWRVRWRTKFKSSVADNNERIEDWDFYRTRNEDRCAAGESSCITNPEVPLYLYYPSYTRHDLSVSYSMRMESVGDLRLFGGIKNIFDDMGPFMPTGGDTYESGPGNFDSKYDGGVGRFAYVGAEIQFE
jgi:outer membrane receptor protein involved in Fe transport